MPNFSPAIFRLMLCVVEKNCERARPKDDTHIRRYDSYCTGNCSIPSIAELEAEKLDKAEGDNLTRPAHQLARSVAENTSIRDIV